MFSFNIVSTNESRGFGRFLATLGGLAGLFLVLWGGLVASTALEHERFPVVGKVQLDGQPAAGAKVALYRLDREPARARAAAWGQVASDGTFHVKTLGFADGAPAGKYAVTVVYEPLVIRGEDYVPGSNIVSSELADPTETPLVIDVLPEPNNLGLLSLATPLVTLAWQSETESLELSQNPLSQGER